MTAVWCHEHHIHVGSPSHVNNYGDCPGVPQSPFEQQLEELIDRLDRMEHAVDLLARKNYGTARDRLCGKHQGLLVAKETAIEHLRLARETS